MGVVQNGTRIKGRKGRQEEKKKNEPEEEFGGGGRRRKGRGGGGGRRIGRTRRKRWCGRREIVGAGGWRI